MLRPWKFQIRLNPALDKSLYLQIADAIKDSIRSGMLKPDDALPGSRQLAELLKVNRNTVVEALDVLLAEGWLISKARKGTFVADISPKNALPKNLPPADASVNNTTSRQPSIVFDDGVPDSRLAPTTALARAYRQIFSRKARWQMMGYSNEYGDSGFREAIARMLNFKRGIGISFDQVCITRGSQMAMYLAAHCLLKQGDAILIENPGYKPAWEAFENAGAALLPVSVDSQGLNIDEVEKLLKLHTNIKAIYTTPHHQFPTTVTLSTERRLKLIELSNKYNFTIIEDDYDNEFHFGQDPVLPISSHPHVKNFVYIGSLSKIVAPALRIGFLASERSFVEKAGSLRKIIDVQGDNIMELAVLELIESGEIKRHMERAMKEYQLKRDCFGALLHRYLDDKIIFKKPEGGLAFWIQPKRDIDFFETANTLLEKGIKVMAPDKFSYKDPVAGFRLGYASLTEQQMEEGIIGLSKVL